MEADIWDALYDVAQHRSVTPEALVSEIDRGRGAYTTTGAVRAYLIRFYRLALQRVTTAQQEEAASRAVAENAKLLLECETVPM